MGGGVGQPKCHALSFCVLDSIRRRTVNYRAPTTTITTPQKPTNKHTHLLDVADLGAEALLAGLPVHQDVARNLLCVGVAVNNGG